MIAFAEELDRRRLPNSYTFMPERFDAENLVLACLKEMEATALGMRQLRGIMEAGPARDMLDRVITEAELQIEETKRKVLE